MKNTQKNVGYDTTIINSNQYFFERTQDNILEKINLFLTNYGFNYKISLYIRTDLLDSKITNKIIMEYDKLIKNSKLKKS